MLTNSSLGLPFRAPPARLNCSPRDLFAALCCQRFRPRRATLQASASSECDCMGILGNQPVAKHCNSFGRSTATRARRPDLVGETRFEQFLLCIAYEAPPSYELHR